MCCGSAWTRSAGAAGALLLLVAAPTAAQQPPDAEHVLEWTVRERWLHGRQRGAFTPWSEARSFLFVDSVVSGAAGRIWYVSFGRPGAADGGIVRRDDAGLVTDVEAWLTPFPDRLGRSAEESAALERRRHFLGSGSRDVLSLPDARLWDVVPSFRPPRLQRGAAWSDTLARVAQEGPLVQALGGVRVSTLLGDTVVEGRTAWWVGHTAEVAYEESHPVTTYTLHTEPIQARQATGSLRGRYLYDPATGLALTRTDTLRMEGEAVIVYADGRAYTTPARFERILRLDRHTPAGYVALRAEELARAQAERGGMVRIPEPLERRLAAGEPAAVDSLLTVLAGARDPERRQELLRLLGRAQGAEALRSVRAALASDTVALLSFRGADRRVTDAQLDIVLPLARDPGLAFDLGLDPDAAFQDLDVLNVPPALEPDTARWPCAPAACERLAQLHQEADPRLRDVGLAAGLALAPVAFAPLVLEAQPTATPLLERALQLVHGVGAPWPASTRRPLPDGRAPWMAWSEWMTGRDPHAAPDETATAAFRRAPEIVRFGRDHLHAIRFHEAATGRNVAAELQPRFNGAEGDTARLVFGTVLQGLGTFRPGPQALARALLDGGEMGRQLALRSLPSPAEEGTFWRPFAPAEAEEEEALVGRFLAVVMGEAEPWSSLPGLDVRVDVLSSAGPEAPVFILADSLAPHLRQVLPASLAPLSQADWDARDPTERARLYRLDRVRTAGPFAYLGLTWTAYLQRDEGQAPRAYMGGHSVTLLRTPDGWRVVALSSWIT